MTRFKILNVDAIQQQLRKWHNANKDMVRIQFKLELKFYKMFHFAKFIIL